MIHALLLAPLLAAGSLTVDDVVAKVEAGRITVDVATSAPVARPSLAAKLEDGRLKVYVGGAKVPGERQTYATGDRQARAFARPKYAKIEIPLEGARCRDAIELEPTAAGLRARVACDGAAAASGGEALRRALTLPADEAPAPPRSGRPNVEPAPAVRAEPPVVEAPAPKPAAGAPAPKPAPAPDPAPAPVPAAAPAAAAAPIPAAPEARPAPGPTSSGASLFLPALALAGLAGAAFVLGRRRAKRPSAIKILETASLGPRRALVLAEIEGETMLLGSSEAGITMLRALPGRAATTAAAPRPEAASALEARVEPDQAGYLSRLFKRPEASAAPVAGAEAPSEGDKAFDEIFRESLEDEDLRRRLAAGLPGKVS